MSPLHAQVLALTAAMVLSCAKAPAQLTTGDVGVTWLSTSQFTVVQPGGTSVVFDVGSFLGSGASSTILLDPIFPDTFLIGGGGFLGRATITGPMTASYTLLANGVGLPAQLAWDGTRIVVIDFGLDQILRVDPVSGAVTPVTSGPQPWGTDLNAGTFDVHTGRLYAGGNNGIWMIAPGSATAVSYAANWSPGMSYVSGIAIDPLSFEPVATLLTVNRIVRIAPSGSFTDLVPPGSVPGPNSIDVDAAGDFIVGASFGQIHRVPRAGGSPVLIGTASGVIGAATGTAVARPTFRAVLVARGGGAATLAITGIPAGTLEGWTIPSFDVGLAPGAGPVFGFSPDPVSLAVIATFQLPVPGSPFHWTWGTPVPGLFPAAPLELPLGAFAPGIRLDLIALAFGAGGTFAVSPVFRAVFP